MRTKYLSFLLTVLISMAASVTSAHDFEVDGIYYNITSSTSPYTVAVTYRGSSYSEYSNEYTGSVTIPESVTYNSKTYSVTSIGSCAFIDCSSLTAISIPNNVTKIGGYVFSGCSSLTSVRMPEKSISFTGFYAWGNSNNIQSVYISNLEEWLKTDFSYGNNPLRSDCGSTLYLNNEAVTNLIIPNGITSLKAAAFEGCISLISVIIPNSVTTIGWGAFDNCVGLQSVIIPNSVTGISDYAFSDCSGLVSVTIPNSVASIGNNVFENCKSLSSVIIGNNVTSIGTSAFSGCSGLTDVFCYSETKPSTASSTFDNTLISNASLHVPENAIEEYRQSEPWNHFGTIVSLTNDDTNSNIEDETVAISNGRYYLQNIATGRYWGSGNVWSTQASLVKHPEFVTLSATSGNKYILESQVEMESQEWYFNGDFMDGSISEAVPISITKIAKGVYTIANNSAYYGWDGYSTVLSKTLSDVTSENAQWHIISEQEMRSNLENATCNNPMDATFLIQDPGLGRNNRYYSAWQWQFSGTISRKNNGTSENFCVESYHVPFRFSQTLSNVPNGVYELTVQGFYRQDGSDSQHLPYLFMNDDTQHLLPSAYGEYTLDAASQRFYDGYYTTDPIIVKVSNNTITMGIELKENTALWCAWDNFELKYYGNTEVDIVRNLQYYPERQVTLTNEYGTFCSPQPLDFTNVEGLKAYIVSAYDTNKNKLTLTRVYDVKPRTGLILRGTAGKTYEIPEGTGATIMANMLVGVIKNIQLDNIEGRFTNFILAKDDIEGIGFYKVAHASTLKAGKAYLQLPTDDLGSEVKGFRMMFDEDMSDGVETMHNAQCIMHNEAGAVYDLQGRRVAKPTKGIYIVNGKKTVIK